MDISVSSARISRGIAFSNYVLSIKVYVALYYKVDGAWASGYKHVCSLVKLSALRLSRDN